MIRIFKSKWMIYAGAALIAALVLYFVIRRRNPARLLIDKASAGLAGKKTTYTPAQFAQMADALYIALKDFGTDETVIYKEIGKLKTLPDLYALIVAYGTRRVHDNLFMYEDYNLAQALSADLSTGELDKLNEILAKSGINYKF
jgi:hypothetical protein